MELYETSFSITSKQGRQSYIALLWRTDGVYIFSSFVIIALCISGLSDLNYKPLAGFGLGVTSVFWYGWLYGLHRARVIFTSPTCSVVNLKMSDEFITFTTSESTSSLRWNSFSQLHCMKNFWILERLYNRNYSLIPVEALNAESSAFLKLKMKEARVKIQ